MKILIIGTGYVGLVTGACFAESGHIVTCLDIDKKKIKNLKKGVMPIYEPGLEELVERNQKEKRLSFTNNYELVADADIIFFSLPTPSKEDGSCDLSYILKASLEVSKYLKNYTVIVNKSTVPVETAMLVKDIIEKNKKREASFDVVSNPEFLKEGSAILDCMKPDRIIIGSDSKKATKIMREAYSPFMVNHEKIIEMDIFSAELTKYAANAMLATRISFMNELAEICKRYNADINYVRKGIGSDARIGDKFLYAGAGFGGSCFPKDLKALIHSSKAKGYEPLLLNSVEAVNEKQKKILSKNINNYFEKKGGISGKTIAIWGLSFKPDTDDLRESPSLNLIKDLLKKGAKLRVYDPIAMEKAKKLLKDLKNITFCHDEKQTCLEADGIALVTEWKQFRLVNFKSIKDSMKTKAFFDGRNQYRPVDMKKQGFDYVGIGVADLVEN